MQIVEWKRQLLEHAAEAFGGGAQAVEPVDLAPLHAKIDQQALELDFLAGALTKAGLLSAKRGLLRDQLHREGVHVGRRHISTLVRRMGIHALAPQPGTSKRAPVTTSTRTCCAPWAIARTN